MENIDVIMEHAEGSGAFFKFHPALATVARGLSESSNKMYKLEDVSDEKTFIIIDPVSDELLIQINAKTISNGRIRVYLKTESGEIIDCDMTAKGKIYKGIIKELPPEKFQIIIEEAE